MKCVEQTIKIIEKLLILALFITLLFVPGGIIGIVSILFFMWLVRSNANYRGKRRTNTRKTTAKNKQQLTTRQRDLDNWVVIENQTILKK